MNYCCKYCHYYLGSRYRFTWPNGDYVEEILDCILYGGMLCGTDQSDCKIGTKDDMFEICDFRNDGNFQLFLLHKCEMSEEQKEEYYQLCRKIYNQVGKTELVETAESLDFLFKNSIDVFDLLESGQALHLSIVNILQK